MTMSQTDKAKKFRALHEAPGAFVIPNPWDAGSARMLAGLGFEALATSSGAKAGVLGKRDGKVTREEALANAQDDRRGLRPAGVRRPREGLWRCARCRGRDDPTGGRRRPGRRLDRGRDRRQGQAAVRHRGRGPSASPPP